MSAVIICHLFAQKISIGFHSLTKLKTKKKTDSPGHQQVHPDVQDTDGYAYSLNALRG